MPLEPSGAPQALTVSATSSTSISVSWDPVVAEDRNGIIKGYKVNYHALPNVQMVTEFLNITKEQQNKRQTVTLDNLDEFTNYSIEVLAFTVFGNGPASVGQLVETLEDSKFYASILAVIVTLNVFVIALNHIIFDAETLLCDTECFQYIFPIIYYSLDFLTFLAKSPCNRLQKAYDLLTLGYLQGPFKQRKLVHGIRNSSTFGHTIPLENMLTYKIDEINFMNVAKI